MGRRHYHDESDVRVRPGKGSRPRTKDRPTHDDAAFGMVITSSLALVTVAGVLVFTGQAFLQLLMLMFIADCVEYGQWKLGRRNESVTLSVQPFIYKASNAIGSGFVGLALVVSGISGAATVDDVTPAGIAAFKAVMLLIPLALFALSWLVLRAGYRLDERRYAEIVADLNAHVAD